MIYKFIGEQELYNDFLPLIIDIECGRLYDENNLQHVAWLRKRIYSIFLMGGTALCVYSDDAAPVGFLLYQHDKGLENTSGFGKKAHIIMFEINENFRSQGIGKIMLDKVCEQIMKDGGECLYTDTNVPNKRAIKFYVENDFVPVAVHEGVNGIGDFGQIYLYKILKKT